VYRLFRFFVCLLLLSDVCLAYTLDDVEIPPDTRATYVGDVVQNGLPMQMLQFTSRFSIAELLAYYKQHWSNVSNRNDNVPAYIEKQVGEWAVLSKIEASKNVVVQVKESDNSTSEGFISVSDFSQRRESSNWVSDFPRMYDSVLISNTESEDKARRAHTLIFINDHSISENSEFYRVRMDEMGWRYSRGGVRNDVAILQFMKDQWHCDITFTVADDGKSVILANLVELNNEG
jgi:hypothetical protein